MLFVNADDLGWTAKITDRILACYNHGRIHGASAMTFMKDSQRAAMIAIEVGMPVGLHLNFYQEFADEKVPSEIRNKHTCVVSYLNANKINQVIFNPFLRKAFDYSYQAQWDEFCRLYGKEPAWLDGHHHMHLCMNMLFSARYPRGIKIRRNFTFQPNEKNVFNRLYRSIVDRLLIKRFKSTDYFYSINPLHHKRLQRVVKLARSADVELMVHPGVDEEYEYLLNPEWSSLLVGEQVREND